MNVLTAMFKNIHNGGLRDSDASVDPPPPRIFITKWIDYSNKYGLGYQLRDGSVGVYFNDSTSVILAADNHHFEYLYYDKGSDRTVMHRKALTMTEFPPDLVKKVTLLKHFRGYMQDNLFQAVQDGSAAAPHTTNLDFLTKYLRTKAGVIFRLSNHVVQLNLFDHSKIILSSDGLVVTFIDANRHCTTRTLASFARSGDKEILDRLKYMREVLHQMLLKKQRRTEDDLKAIYNSFWELLVFHMGREKGQRVKGNQQPAASSRAADLLATTPLGFGFPTPTGAPAFGSSEDFDLTQAPVEVKVLFKRFSKRDNITRVKALEELASFIDNADVDTVGTFLSAWPKTYNRLSTDADRKVREMTGTAHLALVQKMRKQLAPHLKTLIGSWLLTQQDPHKEVARLAQAAFQSAFPTKQSDVLTFCLPDILRFVIENVLHQTPETLSDPRFTSPEDMQSRYARVVSGSVLVLGALIGQLPNEAMAKEAGSSAQLYDEPKFWKLGQHEQPSIRRAFYGFIRSSTLKDPSILSSRLEMVAPVFPGRVFADTEIANHGDMWESLLLFTRAFPESWVIASRKKPLLAKLYTFLQNAAYGSASVTYPSLLPLIAHLSPELLASQEFQTGFFPAVWSGLQSNALEKGSVTLLFESYWECVAFALIQNGSEERRQTIVQNDIMRPINDVFFPLKAAASESLMEASTRNIVKLSLSTQVEGSTIREIMAKIHNTLSTGVIQSKNHRGEPLPCTSADTLASASVDFLATLHSAASAGDAHTVKSQVETIVSELFTECMSGLKDDDSLVQMARFARLVSEKFASSLFEDDATAAAVSDFTVSKLPELAQKNHEAIPHMLDIAVVYIGQLSTDQTDEFRKSWQSVLRVLNTLSGTDKLESISAVLKEVHQQHVRSSFDLRDPDLETYIFELYQKRLGSENATTGSIQDIIAIAMICNEDLPMLSSSSRATILEDASSELARLNQVFLHSDSAPYELRPRRVIAILRIIESALTMDSAKLCVFWPMLPDILATASLRPDAISLGQPGDAQMESLIETAKAVWLTVARAARENAESIASLIDTLSATWRSYLEDITYTGGISSLTAYAQTIAELEASDPAQQSRVRRSLLGDKVCWKTLRASRVNVDATRGILEPLVTLSKAHVSENEVRTVPTDTQGFTVYGRLATVAAALLSKSELETADASVAVELLCFQTFIKEASTGTIVSSLAEHTDFEISKLLSTLVETTEACKTVEWHRALALTYGKTLGGDDVPPSTILLESAVLSAFSESLIDDPDYCLALRAIFVEIFAIADLPSECASVWVTFVADAIEQHPNCSSALVALLAPKLLQQSSQTARQSAVLRVISKIGQAGNLNGYYSAASAYMSIINALLGLYNPQANTGFGFGPSPIVAILPANKVVELLRRVRGWYEQNGTVVGAEDRGDLDKEVAIFIAGVIKDVDIGINLGSFVTSLCKHWITEANVETGTHQVLLYYKLAVYQALLSAQETYADAFTTFADSQVVMERSILKLFVSQDIRETESPTTSFLRLLESLAHNSAAVKEDILLSVDPFAQLCGMLYLPSAQVQVVVYGLLRRLTSEHVQAASLRVEMRAASAQQVDEEGAPIQTVVVASSDEAKVPSALVAALSRAVAPWDFDIHTPGPDSDSFDGTHSDMLGYLLATLILFDHVEDATYDLKAAYVAHMRHLNVIPQLLDNVFLILGVGWTRTPFDLTRWEVDQYDVRGFDEESHVAFPLLAAHAYWKALRNVPSLVRIWWAECKNRQLTIAVESYTEKHFSPLLIRTEVEIVQKSGMADVEDLVIKVSKSGNEVCASYTVEDATLEMLIRLPPTFPLRQVDVDSGTGAAAAGGRAAGISEARWRAWLLSASAVIASQNGSIADAVKLYGKNISLHFKGVEDCAICYSVIGVIDRTLPTKQCKTCKHKFHASCLFK
ncbi:listerin E3 ubiquitin protein ligase 1, partial [Thoreauomyces humboldtii]